MVDDTQPPDSTDARFDEIVANFGTTGPKFERAIRAHRWWWCAPAAVAAVALASIAAFLTVAWQVSFVAYTVMVAATYWGARRSPWATPTPATNRAEETAGRRT